MERIRRAELTLREQGFVVQPFVRGEDIMLAATRNFFRVQWGAVVLHAYVFLWKTDRLDLPGLSAMLEWAQGWAAAHRKARPGWIGVQAVIFVVFPTQATPEAVAFVAKAYDWKIASVRIVALSLADGTKVMPKQPLLVGFAYRRFFRNLVSSLA